MQATSQNTEGPVVARALPARVDVWRPDKYKGTRPASPPWICRPECGITMLWVATESMRQLSRGANQTHAQKGLICSLAMGLNLRAPQVVDSVVRKA
jgi:hypothetical protein